MPITNDLVFSTEQPWKAFLGDWIYDEIMRTFGIEFDTSDDNCCYVLVKLSKIEKTVKLDSTKPIRVKEFVDRAIDRLDVNDTAAVRRFMKSYGTHYIDSYVTGNFIYQVSDTIRQTNFQKTRRKPLCLHLRSSLTTPLPPTYFLLTRTKSGQFKLL